MSLLTERQTSGFPISIGTALTLESIFDPIKEVYDSKRELPPKVDISKYDSIYFNVRVLLRNMIGAIQDTSRNTSVTSEELYSVLIEEMDFMNFLFGQSNTTVVYYVATYERLRTRPLYKDLITLRTHDPLSKEHVIRELIQTVINELARTNRVIQYNSDIIPYEAFDTSLIMTSVPWDLLSHRKFKTLDLIESNTGKLKTKDQWNTKYHPIGQNDLSHLPFTELLLIILGDHSLIKPYNIIVRRELYNVSVADNWSVISTDKKIIDSLAKTSLSTQASLYQIPF